MRLLWPSSVFSFLPVRSALPQIKMGNAAIFSKKFDFFCKKLLTKAEKCAII